MNDFFRFLASFQGRIIRIVAGILLAFWGIFTGGVILLVIGIIPLAAGIFDKCVFAPIFKLPFDGPALRKALEKNNASETSNAPNAEQNSEGENQDDKSA